MSELERTGAVGGCIPRGAGGRTGEGAPGVRLREVRAADLVLVNGAGDAALGADLGGVSPPGVGAAVAAGDLRLLGIGPGQWLARARGCGGLRARLEEALAAGDATVTDLGHARTVLRVEGARSRDLLAKGCPVDVDAMAPGACAATRLGPFNVVVDAVAADAFEVYVFRSFGRALAQWLVHEAGEFGYEWGGEAGEP